MTEYWRVRGWLRGPAQAAIWIVSLSLAPLLWNMIGAVAEAHGIILFRSEVTNRPTSYLGEVWYQLHGGKQSVLHFSPLPYLEWYVVRQGWLPSILLAVGFAFTLKERSGRWIIPTGLVLVPYFFFIFAPFIVPRNLDAALPFTALLSAAGLVTLLDRVHLRQASGRRSSTPRLTVIALLVLLFGTIQVWPLTGVRSGFAQAANYVQRQSIIDRHRDSGALVVNEVMLFYLRDPGRGCDAPHLPGRPASLAHNEGIASDYAVIDQYSSKMELYLHRHAHVVIRLPIEGTTALWENLIASENGAPPRRRPTYVDVYALDSLHLGKLGSSDNRSATAPRSCTLERLT